MGLRATGSILECQFNTFKRELSNINNLMKNTNKNSYIMESTAGFT